LQKTVEKFQAEYPDAAVTTDKGYESGSSRHRYESITYDIVRIKFTNGIQMSYRVYTDGSLSRVSLILPNNAEDVFRKNLSQMKF
jgi:hypothetical protein